LCQGRLAQGEFSPAISSVAALVSFQMGFPFEALVIPAQAGIQPTGGA
jgi:hypothetical protein